MQILTWTVLLAAICYGVGLSLLYFKQREFIFPIPEATRTSPEAAGFSQAEEHQLTTADGETIIVWHVPAKPSRPVIIYFPGNGDFLAAQIGRFQKLTEDGNGLIAVSYRGYAGSSGAPSEKGLLQDAAAAYVFAKARYDAHRIVVWGFSLGTGSCHCSGCRERDPEAGSGSALLVDGGCCCVSLPLRAGALAPAGSVSLGSSHRTDRGSASDHAWRSRPDHSRSFRRAAL